MRISFLGTSHGDPTQTRQQSATLLEIRGRYYLIDAGDGVSTTLIRSGIRPSMISGVFITHMHVDHTGGLPVMIEQAGKYRKAFPDIKLAVRLPDPTGNKAFHLRHKSWSVGNAFFFDGSASAWTKSDVIRSKTLNYTNIRWD